MQNQVIGKYLPYLNVLACFWAKTENITEECFDSFLQDLQFIYLFIYWLYWVFGEGNGTPLQYSCLENPMDRGAWKAAVHGVAKSWTRLSDFAFTFHFHALEKEMATHSSVLAWRIPGTGQPGGCRRWDHTESDMTEVT